MNPLGAALAGKTPGGSPVFLPPLPPEEHDPFLEPLRRDAERWARLRWLGAVNPGEAFLGPCPPSAKDNQGRGGLPRRARVRVGPHTLRVELVRERGPGEERSRPPRSEGPRERRTMRRSLQAMGEAAAYLERAGARPTHLLTLTVPTGWWAAIPVEERPRVWREAKRAFFKRLGAILRKRGLPVAYLRWDEFTRAGVPHAHAVLDLGARWLPRDVWRSLAGWVASAWPRALAEAAGVPLAKARTQLHALRAADFRYVKAYSRKPSQKNYPHPGDWGRTWDVAGAWREALRTVRRQDREEAVVWEGDPLGLLVLWDAWLHVCRNDPPAYLRDAVLPVVQAAEVWEGGEGEGLVLRRRARRFWESPQDREAWLQALALVGVPPPPRPFSPAQAHQAPGAGGGPESSPKPVGRWGRGPSGLDGGPGPPASP